jgi:hypothetical protein
MAEDGRQAVPKVEGFAGRIPSVAVMRVWGWLEPRL